MFLYPPLQPDAIEDFPTTVVEKPRIPHIIHQTWTTVDVPFIYWDNIKTVIKHNPTWKYYFWTAESAQKLIADRYPRFLKTWKKLTKPIYKADALRYIVLYEYGGFYMDLDIEVHRNLNRTAKRYSCIVGSEPFEHAVFLYEKHFYLNNNFMAARPRHPFFKQVANNLAKKRHFGGDFLAVAGPKFLHKEYLIYNGISDSDNDSNRTKTDCSSNSPYFYKGELPEDHDDAVYIPNTAYFTDTLDLRSGLGVKLHKKCDRWFELTYLQKRACSDIMRKGAVRRDRNFRFVTHKWSHIYSRTETELEGLEKKNIVSIVPYRYIYGVNK